MNQVPPDVFADKPVLQGERVTLRPVTEADAEALHGMSAETIRLTGSHGLLHPDALIGMRRWYATRADHDDRLDLAIVERASGEIAGEIVLNELDAGNACCNLRIAVFQEAAYGRGLGSESIRLVLGHAFETAGLHRVDLEVYAFNPRARHVYEKVGFVHEGTRRESLWWDGQWVDAHVMSILDREWRVRTAGR